MVEILIAKMDANTMAYLIAEQCLNIKKPEGMSCKDAMLELEKTDKDAVACFYRAALAVARYMEESINNYNKPTLN